MPSWKQKERKEGNIKSTIVKKRKNFVAKLTLIRGLEVDGRCVMGQFGFSNLLNVILSFFFIF